MTADEVQLELAQLLGWNVNVRQLPEPGADTVNHGALRDDLLDYLARAVDLLMSRSADADRFTRVSDPTDLSEGQCLAG
jgi:hypothetical protein